MDRRTIIQFEYCMVLIISQFMIIHGQDLGVCGLPTSIIPQLYDDASGVFSTHLSPLEIQQGIVDGEFSEYVSVILKVREDGQPGTQVELITGPKFGDRLDIDRPPTTDSNIRTSITFTCDQQQNVPLIIRMTDVNTRPPVFTSPGFTPISIPTNWDKNIPLNWNNPLILSDQDYDVNNANNVLSIEPSWLELTETKLWNDSIVPWPTAFQTSVQIKIKGDATPPAEVVSCMITATDGTLIPDEFRFELEFTLENILPPKFDAESYFSKLTEWPKVGSPVEVEVAAADPDATNTEINYSIEGLDFLELTQNGDGTVDIAFREEFNEEDGWVVGKVVIGSLIATENLPNDPKTSRVPLIIEFPDIKVAGNGPKFSKTFYEFTVPAVPEVGDTIPVGFEATGSGTITYRLADGSPQFVSIDGQDILITQSIPETVGSNNVLLLEIIAVQDDGAGNLLEGTATIALAFPLDTDCPPSSTTIPTSDPPIECPTTPAFDPTTNCPSSTFDPTTACPITCEPCPVTGSPPGDCPTTTESTECPPCSSTESTPSCPENPECPTTVSPPPAENCPTTSEPPECPPSGSTCPSCPENPECSTTVSPPPGENCPTTVEPPTTSSCAPCPENPECTTTASPTTSTTATPPECPPAPEEKKESNTGLVAGIVTVSVISVVSIGAAGYFFMKLRRLSSPLDTSWSKPSRMSVDKLAPRKSFSQSKSMRATVSDAENGFSNPAFNSDPSDGSNLEKSIPRASNSTSAYDYVERLDDGTSATEDVSPYASTSLLDPPIDSDVPLTSGATEPPAATQASAPIRSALATPKEIVPDYEVGLNAVEEKSVPDRPRGVRIADEVEILNDGEENDAGSDSEDEHL